MKLKMLVFYLVNNIFSLVSSSQLMLSTIKLKCTKSHMFYFIFKGSLNKTFWPSTFRFQTTKFSTMVVQWKSGFQNFSLSLCKSSEDWDTFLFYQKQRKNDVDHHIVYFPLPLLLN